MNNRTYIHFLAFILVLCLPVTLQAQKKKKKKREKITVTSRIVDETGTAIPRATITLGEGMLRIASDEKGKFSLKTASEGKLLVEAGGYQSQWVELGEVTEEIVLARTLLLASAKDAVDLPLGQQISQRALTGAVSGIEGADLESYPDLSFSNALQGRIMGLQVRQSVNGLGNNSATLYVRGLARGGSDGIITIVDGIERSIDYLAAQEVESVKVLKDATSKILYGPRAANGVVLITTKRGKPNTRVLKVSAEYGASFVTRLPGYLDSYEYAGLYNEARANDGLSLFYSEQDLEGYRNSTGPNDQRYPNAGYHDYFLEEAAAFRKATVEYSGGNDKSQYALVLAYTGGNGIEKIGDKPVRDRINLRGNLDFDINDFMSVNLGASGYVETQSWPSRNNSQVMSVLSSHRPNEYPFLLTDEALRNTDADFPPMGGSFYRPNSLYADLLYGGFSESQLFYGQANLGIDFDFGDILLDGLSASVYYTTDNLQYFQNGKSETAVTYASRWSDTEEGASVRYYPLRRRVIEDNQRRQNQNYINNNGFYTTVSYENRFGAHDIKAGISHIYYNKDHDNWIQDLRFTNTVLRLNYGFNDRWYAEASLAYMGSDKMPSGNRYKLFPAVGAAWVLSEEGFMSGAGFLDFLKLKGSFGILGYDRAMDYYQYENRWNTDGSVQFNERNNTSFSRTRLQLTGNPDLDWEKSREINVGLEGLMLNNRLRFELNYFNEYRYDMLQSPSSNYSVTAGGLFPLINRGENINRGFEAEVNWSDAIGDWNYQVGGLMIFSKNKVLRTNEITYPENQDFIRNTGRPSDTMYGFVAEGLFTGQPQADNHPVQAFGPYGIGNIAYKDLNGDHVVDNMDRKAIGNSFPRTSLGVNLKLDYKRFSLFVLGTAELGADNWLNNSYYWNYGEGKYSTVVRDRYHPVSNPGGTYPALTTTNGINDFRNSTYWLQDASFFRLKNVELSYTLSASKVAKSYEFHIRGTNLFVLSENKDLDPEVINAGVDNYPVFRTVTGGVTINF
ncbi:SusC/RagA family TonB-linked outer membrane protein [Sinomicrobium soli]|uniref:SusC/RagA family TonB-linked outer membrane protein n=1 Tax=Sinomicrobium sp. N-1-3-6 TaxID=2219864 RepID=UPI0013749BF2|nr:SusC/RagA family TonB-linked outer membrane protein [Sinomicrobium sp. N-1-3-6]